jgi:hypothetical protein
MKTTAKPFLCACGDRAATYRGHRLHIDAGTCPKNPPADSKLFPGWCLGIGHDWITRPKTEEEKIKREERLEKARALKDNPEYQEHARQKKEAKKALRDRCRALMGARRGK